MRLHAVALALLVIGAHAASIPDKKDIEKKLAKVVKEVLNKDEKPIENMSSEQELIEPTIPVKDVENNLRKSVQPADIPVKIVVEDVKPAMMTGDKKEDNEVTPENEDSSEIVRPEIDLNNPGLPQHMQHDNQNPEHFEDAQQAIVIKNGEWKDSSQYALIQKGIKDLKNNFESQMNEIFGFIQAHWDTHQAQVDDGQKQDNIKVRASLREDASSSSSSSSSSSGGGGGGGSSGSTDPTNQWGSGPFGGLFQNWAQSFQQSLQNFNQTVNNYWNNSTNSNSSSSDQCGSGNSGAGIFNFGSNNPLNFGQQQGQGQQQQSDEPARPGLWQNLQNNVQSFFGGNPPAPAGAQSDTPQPAQPNRPVYQAFQNVIQQAGSLFNRPQAPGQPETPPKPSQQTTQEGSNVVPAESKPEEQQKEKPEQATVQPQQSGPIKQMLGQNAVVQGIAGAVQRIQHTLVPNRPREEVKDVGEKEKVVKGGWYPPKPNPSASGDNIDVNSSGVEVKSEPEAISEKEEPAMEPIPAKIEKKEEEVAPVKDKTE